jgi:hypothetical protein
MLIRKA